MIKRVLVMAAWVTIILQFYPALAAGSYEGNWTGIVEAAGPKCPQGTIIMQISGYYISGSFGLGGAHIPFKGTIAADGTVNVSYNLPEHSITGNLNGKVSTGEFTGKFESTYQVTGSNCVRNVSAKHS